MDSFFLENHMKRSGRLLIIAFVALMALTIPGCPSGNPSGKYQDDSGAVSVEFKSGNKAYVTLPIGTTQCDYEVDGDKITLKMPGDKGGNVVLTKKSDGSLDGGMMLGTLKKK
jgi:hypothetical protein